MSCPIEIERRVLCAAENTAMASFTEEGQTEKLLVRTKKHEKVLSLQMYQFTFRRSRLHPFLPYFFFYSFFFTTAIAHLIIIHKTPLSAVRENKLPIQKMYFSSLIQRSFLSS